MIVQMVVLFAVVLNQHVLIESTTPMDLTDQTGKATAFLQKYGYVEAGKEAGGLISPEAITLAITEYQNFFGLNETGTLDEATLQQMELPRCGNPDKSKEGAASIHSGIGSIPRIKRALASRGKWSRVRLTYKIWNYPKLHSSKRLEVDKEIKLALDGWTKVSPIEFVRTEGTADINMKFAVKNHCNGGKFDGPRGTLAHAFFPEDGRVHFDDDETWTFGEGVVPGSQNIDLFAVALHEFGHTLGLEHSKDKRSLMYPTYGAVNNLHETDIAEIQQLYGPPRNKPPARPPTDKPPQSPPPERRPNLCKDPTIDAIIMTKPGRVFVFKGDFYWLLNIDADGIEPGFPRLISKDLPGLPGSLDAAFSWKDGTNFFFKGTKYWKFTGKTPAPGYPKPISSGFRGIPSNIDGAFVWNNEQIFFFKGDSYWRYDHSDPIKVKSDYPQPISNWKGVPPNIGDVFRWSNGKTYFFVDDVYYKYDDNADEVEAHADPPFPRSSSEWWFGCEGGLTDPVEPDPEIWGLLNESTPESIVHKLDNALSSNIEDLTNAKNVTSLDSPE